MHEKVSKGRSRPGCVSSAAAAAAAARSDKSGACSGFCDGDGGGPAMAAAAAAAAASASMASAAFFGVGGTAALLADAILAARSNSRLCWAVAAPLEATETYTGAGLCKVGAAPGFDRRDVGTTSRASFKRGSCEDSLSWTDSHFSSSSSRGDADRSLVLGVCAFCPVHGWIFSSLAGDGGASCLTLLAASSSESARGAGNRKARDSARAFACKALVSTAPIDGFSDGEVGASSTDFVLMSGCPEVASANDGRTSGESTPCKSSNSAKNVDRSARGAPGRGVRPPTSAQHAEADVGRSTRDQSRPYRRLIA